MSEDSQSDFRFKQFVLTNRERSVLGNKIAIVATVIFSVLFISVGIAAPIFEVRVIAFAVVLLMVFVVFGRSKGLLKDGDFWWEMITKNPDNIIWIKPIVQKHTAALVLTLYKEHYFELNTLDGLSMNFKCNSPKEQEIFFYGIKRFLPNTHIGYSPEIRILFDDDKTTFVETLKERELFQTIEGLVEE